MLYQQIRRKTDLPVINGKPQSDERPAFSVERQIFQQKASDTTGDEHVDELMQQRMHRFQEHQIPEAEAEADRMAGYASGADTPEEVKAKLGEAMDADFSAVRFHTGADAVNKADSIGARAYTSGQDVYFGQGGFDPDVAAHELVHTAQQGVVESGAETTSAPTGGVQMLSWADFKRGVGNVGIAMGGGLKMAGHGIASAARAVGGGFASAGRGIAGAFRSMHEKLHPPKQFGPEIGTPDDMTRAVKLRDIAENKQQLMAQNIIGNLDPRLAGNADSLMDSTDIVQMPSYSLGQQKQILDTATARQKEKKDLSEGSRAATKAKFGSENHLGDLARRAEALYSGDDDQYNDSMLEVLDRLNGAWKAPMDQQAGLYSGMQGDAAFMQKLQAIAAPVISETGARAANIGAAEDFAEHDYYGSMRHTGKVHAISDLVKPMPEDMRNQVFGGKDQYQQYVGQARSLTGGGTEGAYSRGYSKGVKGFGFNDTGRFGMLPVTMLRILRDYKNG